ncbi:hypothetical protein ELS78_02335 [Aeromonas veronii]|uniref:hypothetical protein n=1 Tax=Aeromonas veronii TaxID=654 RepID=UPI000F8D0529|nr:hypothetical protein [Aeromonas veronii]RUR59214.1 hypothetical protein ELS78_02335 [Aeromonas veronii]
MIYKIKCFFIRIFLWQIINPYGRGNATLKKISKIVFFKLSVNFTLFKKYLHCCKKNKNFYDAEVAVMRVNKSLYLRSELIELGRFLFSIGSYYKVIRFFDGECRPHELWDRYGKTGLECVAKSYLMMKDYHSALKYFQYWGRKQKHAPTPKINLTIIYCAIGETINANYMLNEYLLLKPKCPVGLAYKARLQPHKKNEKKYQLKKRVSEKHNCNIHYDFEIS